MGRRYRSLVIAFLVLAVVGLGFVPFGKILADGKNPVTVTIRSAAGSSIRAVSAIAYDDTDSVHYYLEQPIPPRDKDRSTWQAPYVGEPLIVKIPTSSTTPVSLFWRYAPKYYWGKLVVKVEYQSGTREGRAVDIPDPVQNQTVAVEVP